MKLILFLDTHNGMLFNQRRLSRDQLMYDRIIEQNTGTIWMNHYTAEVFPAAPHIQISEQFLDIMQCKDICIIEDFQVTEEVLSKFNQLTLFKWNRSYPSDLTFECSMNQWKLVSSYDFEGSSHEKITEEYYEKI